MKMIKLIVYIAVIFVLLIVYIRYIEKRGAFFPMKEVVLTPKDIDLVYEDIYIETQDNVQINGWFIPYAGAKYTVIFFHGNAGNLSHRLDKIILLHDIKLNLFIIDYRGYGRSQGSPTEAGLYLDAEAAYDYLVKTRSIKPDEIILYGESLGSGVAVDLASKRKTKGLILEGAYTNAKDMIRKVYPFLPAFLFSFKFDSLTKIKKVGASKLFIHSINDEIIPFDLADKLYRAAKPPKEFIKLNGGHNTAFLDSKDIYVSSIKKFIKNL